MKYIVFDTETNGKPNPLTGKFTKYQDIIELCYWVVDDGKVVKKYSNLVSDIADRLYPEQKVYTMTEIKFEGKKWKEVFDEFLKDLQKLPEGSKVYSHNLDFDKNVCLHSSRNNDIPMEKILLFNRIIKEKGVCTMQSTTNYCKLPVSWNNQSYKWPKLTELHHVLFKKPFNQKHLATDDVYHLNKCVSKLIDLKIL